MYSLGRTPGSGFRADKNTSLAALIQAVKLSNRWEVSYIVVLGISCWSPTHSPYVLLWPIIPSYRKRNREPDSGLWIQNRGTKHWKVQHCVPLWFWPLVVAHSCGHLEERLLLLLEAWVRGVVWLFHFKSFSGSQWSCDCSAVLPFLSFI